MKDLNSPVTTYCKKKCYADHVIEGRLDYLVKDWERTVAHIARGYLEIMKYDYLSDMDGRQIIHDFLCVATEDQRNQVEARIKAADEIYFAHTVALKECIWGRLNENKIGYTSEIHWWYFREPKVRDTNW